MYFKNGPQLLKHEPTLTAMAVSVFAEPTDRDKQRLIGASNFSNPCNKCLAEDMLGIEREPSWAWMGAVIGTAIHGLAEDRLSHEGPLRDSFHNPDVEQRLTLGEIEGYGVIKSTTDLYIPEMNICWDWKTTTKDKLKKITEVIDLDLDVDPDLYSVVKYRDLMQYVFKVKMYINQLHAYARGCIESGRPVDSLAIAFVCRDAQSHEDIRVFKFDYDPELADRVWNRVGLLWKLLQEGKTPDNFDGHEFCWYCNNRR